MTRSKPAAKTILPTSAELDALFATPRRFERWLMKQPAQRTFQFGPLSYFVQDSFGWGPILETAYEVDAPGGTPLYPVASYSFDNTLSYSPSRDAHIIASRTLPDWVQTLMQQFYGVHTSFGQRYSANTLREVYRKSR